MPLLLVESTAALKTATGFGTGIAFSTPALGSWASLGRDSALLSKSSYDGPARPLSLRMEVEVGGRDVVDARWEASCAGSTSMVGMLSVDCHDSRRGIVAGRKGLSDLGTCCKQALELVGYD